jgi:hypothetical protein
MQLIFVLLHIIIIQVKLKTQIKLVSTAKNQF